MVVPLCGLDVIVGDLRANRLGALAVLCKREVVGRVLTDFQYRSRYPRDAQNGTRVITFRIRQARFA